MKRIYLSILPFLAALLLGFNWSVSAQTYTYNFNGSGVGQPGSVQTYTVPNGVYAVSIDAVGASGGGGYVSCGAPGPIVLGGRVQCTMAVVPYQVLYIYVGGAGQNDRDCTASVPAGGWNGGVAGFSYSAGSGGASDIRLSNVPVGTYSTIPGTPGYRVVVAGGGGGGGDWGATGGTGGGLIGNAGQNSTTGGGVGGSGGTQTGPGTAGSAGSAGMGGNPGSSAGGGGGGWYGGNGGGSSGGGGGGGSSWTDGTLCTGVTHTNGYILANGNGSVKIVALCSTPVAGVISGTPIGCVGGAPTPLADVGGSTDGIWVSNNTSVATVGSLTGLVTGVTTGTALISYVINHGLCGVMTPSVVVNVNPAPAPVTGNPFVCSATPDTLHDITPLGTWSSSSPSIATIGSSNGSISAVSQGFTTFSYILPTGCYSNYSTTVNISPNSYTVSGGGAYCAGSAAPHIILNNSDLLISYQLMRGITPVGSAINGSGRSIDFGAQPTSGIYTVMATNLNGGCSLQMAGSATIIMNTPPSANNITAPSGTGFCAGGTGVTLGLNGSLTRVKYQLFRYTGAFGSPLTGTGFAANFPFSLNLPGVYTIVGTDTVTNCSTTMNGSETLTSYPLPTTELVSGGGDYCAGGTGVSVTLNGSDTGVSYNLSIVGGGLYGGSISGTGTSVSFSGVTAAGYYNVIATNNTSHCTNTMSGIASVAIDPLPVQDTISAQDGGGYCAGGAGKHIYLSYSSSGVTYQLYLAGTGSVGFPVSGINDSLDFGVQYTHGSYYIVGKNDVSHCVSTMAGSAVITVFPLPTADTVIGGGSFCAGGTGQPVKLNTSTTGIIYQLNNGGVYTGTADTSTGGLINFGLQTTGGNYTVMAIDPTTGCSQMMTASAQVIVEPLPSAQIISGGGSYCLGGTGKHIYLDGSDSGISYQLYHTGAALGMPINGTSTSLDFGSDTGSGYYTIVGTNISTGCVNNMTGTVSISINPLPELFDITGGGPYCAGGAGDTIGLDFSNVGISYQLYMNGSRVGLPLEGVSGSLSFGLHTASGVYTVGATNDITSCATMMTGSKTISTTPSPTQFNVTGGGGFCIGGTGMPVGLSASNGGINYQLYNGLLAIGSPVHGNGSAINFGNMTNGGNYTVLATNASSGCQSEMLGSATITPYAPPVPYTVTGGGGYCAGTGGAPVGLSYSDTGVKYMLYMGTTMIGSAIPGVGGVLSFGDQTAAGTYTVKGINTSTTCESVMSGEVAVVINPLPYANSVTGGGSYCAGGNGVPVGLGGSNVGINYQLFIGTTPSSIMGGTGAAISFGLQTVPAVYTVKATNTTTSCTADMFGTATVNVNALPTRYSVSGGGSFCADSTVPHVMLSATDAGIHYQLYNGTAMVGGAWTGTGSGIDFGPIGTSGSYWVGAVNTATSCSDNMMDTAGVNRMSLIVPSVSIFSSATTVCAGTPVTFSASPVNGGSTPTYQWFVTGSPVAGSSSYTYNPGNGDVVTAVLTSSAMCPSGPATSMGITMIVNPVQTVSVSTASMQDSVCQGTTEFFYALPTNGGINPTYTWYYDGIKVQSGPGLTYSWLPANGDNVYVVMQSSVPCPSADSVVGNTITMYVQQVEIPNVSITSNPAGAVSMGTPVTFTANATNVTIPSYQWDVNGNVIAGNDTHTFTANNFNNGDVVTCTVTNNDLCGMHSGSNFKTVQILPEGVAQVNSTGSNITVTPNPNNGEFTIKGTFGSADVSEVTIEMMNVLGQQVYGKKVLIQNGAINENVHLDGELSNGMYILNIRSGSENAVYHVILEK